MNNDYQQSNQNTKAECAKGNHQWFALGMAPKQFNCMGCGTVSEIPPPTQKTLIDMRNLFRD